MLVSVMENLLFLTLKYNFMDVWSPFLVNERKVISDRKRSDQDI